MRIGPIILSGVILAGMIALSGPAQAQVSMDDSALDALRQPAPRRAAPVRRRVPVRQPASPPVDRKPADAQAAAPGNPQSATASPSDARKPPTKPGAPAQRAEKPTVPATPPAILALPAPIVVPLAHPPPPPVVTVAADAPGAATVIQGGLRVTFGPDRADLNPVTVAALREFAHAQVDQPRTSINIFAYASGSPDDASTPRRLSLERALAARAVLLEQGIPSPRIYPRALGPAGGTVDPDRVDVLTGSPTPPAQRSAG